ncbi:hypothetical protein ACI2KR_08250 [Pseudomonas luteola]
MITQQSVDELKSILNTVREAAEQDELGQEICAVGISHLNAMIYSLRSKTPLSSGEQRQLEVIIDDFKEIVDEYLAEMV